MDVPQPRQPGRLIVTFCGQCDCGCPELYVDDDDADDRRIVITDDFGRSIQMSVDQLRSLVFDVKSGVLDDLVGAASV